MVISNVASHVKMVQRPSIGRKMANVPKLYYFDMFGDRM
jgi:hypothetical protein